MKEIGSEFWTEECVRQERFRRVAFSGRSRGFLCGRTALDYIIRDAKQTVGFEAVLLPSYCCHTMIEPFVRNGIRIRFYPVTVDKNGIACRFPSPQKEEALYLMPYFGFGMPESYQLQAKQWKFCILDETHSCFSGFLVTYTDWNIKYTYASYRKWSDIRGFAIANKIADDFALPYEETYHNDYLMAKSQACMLKQDYIEKGTGDKQRFLGIYRESEEMLDRDYENYASMPEGVDAYEKLDIDTICRKRRENGSFLMEAFGGMKGIRVLYPSLSGCCPLFIPILVEDGLRDGLRKYFIDNQIYCPVHWPKSEYLVLENTQEKELYEKELSVICDQRYDISDMKRIVQCISRFMES